MNRPAAPIRVMLCESRRIIGEALCETLSRADGLQCLGVAKTYWAARRQLAKTPADVVVVCLDYHEEELLSLIGVARGARVALLANPVTAQMLSLQESRPELTVVSSTAPLADLVRNLSGQSDCGLNDEEPTTGQLSRREFQTLTLLVEGMTTQEMAEHLHLSIHTVRFHIKALLAKLNVNTQSAAILAGIERGLVSPPPRVTHTAVPAAR